MKAARLPPAADGLAAAVEDALASGAAGRGLVVHVPVPMVAPQALWHASDEPTRVLFAPPDDAAFAGVGVVAEARGPTAGALLDAAKRLLSSLDEQTLGGEPAPSARLFGGVPFAPDAGAGAGSFEAGRLVLPRLRLSVVGDRAWLSVAALSEERAGAAQRRTLALLVAEAAARLGRPSPAGDPAHALALDEGDTEGFLDLVRGAVEAIAEGRLQKVVLARASRVTLAVPADPVALLDSLASGTAHGARLALADGETAFVAFSPERLVRVRGLQVESEALAGTVDAARAATLAASPKDAQEHAHVVRAIGDSLAPLCRSLTVPSTPGIRALRHVHHLHTPIEGVLAEPRHVLELVAALHPTPAVGGVPREEALRFIAHGEAEPRGLYAGPIGWCDASGDGDFWVGLRSGVLTRTTAQVWAGAGIVAASEPAAELAETRLKQRGLLCALGVVR